MSFNIEEYSPRSEPDAYREWFEQWQKFCPWDEKKILILERLDRASRSYRSKFDDRDVTLRPGDALYGRLLYSLTFHWTKTSGAPPGDEEETITSLETRGRGGSNPLEDLTLVDSMLAEVLRSAWRGVWDCAFLPIWIPASGGSTATTRWSV